MSFTIEQTGYQKTILSDLQGAWFVFRQSVVDSGGFENWDRVLLHTDEAMSWETVRNLNRMPPLVLAFDPDNVARPLLERDCELATACTGDVTLASSLICAP